MEEKFRQQMITPCQVHPTVREFIICTTGSDFILPEKDDWLWIILKQHLEPAPANTEVVIPESERTRYVNIVLLDAHNFQIYARDKKKLIYINTLFRWFLSEKSQRVIARHLRSQFKACFHNFMQGALSINPEIEITDAISEFCNIYKLTFNKISFEMLRKSWYRSQQKGKIDNPKNKKNPLVF